MDRYAVYRDISPGYVVFDTLSDTVVALYHDRREAERAPGVTKPIRYVLVCYVQHREKP